VFSQVEVLSMFSRRSILFGLALCLWGNLLDLGHTPVWAQVDEAALRNAVLAYASFDEQVKFDFTKGSGKIATRSGQPMSGSYTFTDGFDSAVYQIAAKGIHGGCLKPVSVLPNNGRIFIPGKDNLAFRRGGWSGAGSVWINLDPNETLKTRFCDPFQITHKGANNGGIWFDFNEAKPRDMRMGIFSAVPEGQKPVSESDPAAPLVGVKQVAFKAGEWHHIVVNWKNLDTGKPDAEATFYVDGKPVGNLKDQAMTMAWDMDKVGIYVAVNFLGQLDEFAIFGRSLSASEVEHLYKHAGCLSALKK
jgi:hypothetical protein